jgi:hypothetical protein
MGSLVSVVSFFATLIGWEGGVSLFSLPSSVVLYLLLPCSLLPIGRASGLVVFSLRGPLYFFPFPFPPSSNLTTNRSSSMLIVIAVTRPTTETSSG